MELEGKRVAVLAENMYQELELWYPLLRLREAGAETFVVGSGSADTYTSKLGYPVSVDRAAGEVSAAEIDAVVIPGGYAPDLMRRQPAMVQLVRQAFEQGKTEGDLFLLHQRRPGQRRGGLCRCRGSARWQPDYLARAVRSARLLPDHHRGVEGIAPRPRAARGLPGDRLSPVRRPFIFPVRCSRCPASHSHTTTPATAMTA